MKKETNRKKDIAIVGMSCHFPKSESLEKFWKNIEGGKELIHFYSDQELTDLGVAKKTIAQDNYIKADAMVKGKEYFDHLFFGYTNEEAKLMDPQIRFMHQIVWSALEDSGCDLSQYPEKIGLYLSASDNINWKAYENITSKEQVAPFLSARLADRTHISTIISYRLNLKGPSYFVDTACSGSLVAVHMACRNLLLRECSMAVAGGVSLDSTIYRGYFYEEGMINTKDGHCKTFSKDASGTIWGEGAGVVVLKRWEDAIRDKDQIYAVIKGSAVNNDGKQKVGYTAPSLEGQYECIRTAHKISGIRPETVSYIEAHGTATSLGDPIEVAALNKAFGYNKDHTCKIGSVKTNMGHLDAAAGIAGLIKTSLALKHKKIPPSLHFSEPNLEIDFQSGPFVVAEQLEHWEPKQGVRRAGVSSFGIGGTNVHVVLEEAEMEETHISENEVHIIPFSAKTPVALKSYNEKLQEFLSDKGNIDLSKLSYTLLSGREHFAFRNCVVGTTKEEIVNALRKHIETFHKTPSRLEPLVFLFSGQGTQYYLMGKHFYETNGVFKENMDTGFKILKKLMNIDYSKVLGYVASNISTDTINDTFYTQPLLFLVEYATAKMLEDYGLEPDYMIGHSLGEYTAACVGGVFSLEDGLSLLTKRAELMGTIQSGSMLNIGAPFSDIQKFIHSEVSVAAINTEDSCVISGNDFYIAEIEEKLAIDQIPFIRLKTSHAFHSSMMDGILEDYRKVLSKIKWNTSNKKIISNLSGKEVTTQEVTSPEYWVRHLRETVQFSKGCSYLLQNIKGNFLEIGPGQVLINLLKQQKNYKKEEHKTFPILPGHREKENPGYERSAILGKLWARGINIKWDNDPIFEKGHKITIPTYTFEKYKFPSEVNPFEEKEVHFSSVKKDPTLYYENWKRQPQIGRKLENHKSDFLIFSEGGILIQKIAKSLQKKNRVVFVEKGKEFIKKENSFIINPEVPEHFTQLFKEIDSENFTQIIYNWYDEEEDKIEQLFYQSNILFNLGMELVRYAPFIDKRLTMLQPFNYSVLGTEKGWINLTTASVITDSFIPMYSTLLVTHIDVDQDRENDMLVQNIIKDIEENQDTKKVAYRGYDRWVAFYDEFHVIDELNEGERNHSERKTYLVIDEGDISEKAIDALKNENVILIGKAYKKISISQENRYDCDFNSRTELESCISKIESDHGTLSGVYIGNLLGQSPSIRDEQFLKAINVQEYVSNSITYILRLLDVLKERNLDFIWIATNASSFLGIGNNGLKPLIDSYILGSLRTKHQKLPWILMGLNDHVEERSSHEFNTNLPGHNIYLNIPNSPNALINQSRKQKESAEGGGQIERPDLSIEYIAPESEIEEQLCNIWKTFFGFEKVGVQDDFFEMGGDSLKAMSLLKRIEKDIKITIAIQDFYENTTVRALSKEIEIALGVIKMQQEKEVKKTITI